jgi:hypothetical protein
VQYGRKGTLETGIGDIPVYHSVRDVMLHGHAFDIGVVYLPPAAVSQAVWELVRFNKDLKRIVIVTEKVSTRDSRNIRYICQNAGVDVIGANCLGVANAWDHVRVGGALGGDAPEEALKKGSVAIHSNSGGVGHFDRRQLGQGRDHSFRPPRISLRGAERHTDEGGGRIRGAGRVLRKNGAGLDQRPGFRLQQAHRGVRDGTLEEGPGALVRPRGRDVGQRR